MAEERKTYKFVCTVCGYEVEVDTPELPEDYVCPVCGVGPDAISYTELCPRAPVEFSAGALLIYLTV